MKTNLANITVVLPWFNYVCQTGKVIIMCYYIIKLLGLKALLLLLLLLLYYIKLLCVIILLSWYLMVLLIIWSIPSQF
jgi:hypothetical protein